MKAIAALVLAVCAACGGQTAGDITADPTPSTAPTPFVRFKRADVAAEWFLLAIENQGGTLRIGTTGGGCTHQGHLETQETDTVVTVRAFTSVDQGAEACTQELAFFTDRVALQAPLGDRKLVGCRVGKTAESEDAICRDLGRGEKVGFSEFTAPPG